MLSEEILAAIVQRVFIECKSTLLAESAQHQAADLVATCLELREQMRPCLDSLDASTFVPKPNRQPGEEAGWTAGEIVSTNSDRLVWALTEAAFTIGLQGDDLPPTPQLVVDNAAYQPKLLDRNIAFEVLPAATSYFKLVFPLLLSVDCGQTAARTHHGPMSLKSWLLLICIHDDDHLRQLRTRAEATPTGL
ncbi:MAG: hypothetical protein GKR89_09740 [Candidatus Latescibacteria bacterium]|nr:hypothetical protein [Candidatus Latescibacterota bacterium]